MSENRFGTSDEISQIARETMDQTLDAASDTLASASEGVAKVREAAEPLVRGARDSAREAADQLRDRATRASDSMAKYIRDEPVKSVLIASVAGAAIVALASLLGDSRQ